MRYVGSAVTAIAVLMLSGCYHATIDTGLTPSLQTIERPWAHGFVYGLVPPSTVETQQRCPTGVARVETRLSFLNQVANILTFSIYTPMSIKVTCAAAGGMQQDATALRPSGDLEPHAPAPDLEGLGLTPSRGGERRH
ncbi:MAG: Bor family protein [Gemmatimonadetes bacterium]|nr:Bor family protein [Gemmatimonadota bacterium]